MSAKIISMFSHLVDTDRDAISAVRRAMKRPMNFPLEAKEWPDERMSHEVARWFLEGLWLEGFRVVRGGEDEDYE